MKYTINNNKIHNMDSVIVTKDIILPYTLIRNYEKENCDLSLSGAQSIFIGYMRVSNTKRSDITSMKLDHYPKMTLKYLIKLREKIIKEFSLDDVLIVHRVGDVFPEDCLVIVACWSKHRVNAIKSMELILENIKYKAPFWKKEYFMDGTTKWVEKNT